MFQLCVPMVLQTLHMLASAPKLKAVAMRLMTALWKKQVCQFPLTMINGHNHHIHILGRLCCPFASLCLNPYLCVQGPSVPGTAASAGSAGQQGGGGEGRPVGADPGQGSLPQGHLQREVRPTHTPDLLFEA